MGVTIFRPGQSLVIPGVQVYQPRPSAGGAFTGILDSISNVAAAYSLRQLRGAYSGSAVRVRRSSDSTEQDIGFVAGEFDSAAFGSFVGGGTGYVKTWYDQSGNTRDLTQATTTLQPSLIASSINSKPAMTFDGSDDKLQAATAILPSNAVFSLFALISPTSENLAGSCIVQWASGQAGRLVWAANQDDVGANSIGRFNPFSEGATTGAGALGVPNDFAYTQPALISFRNDGATNGARIYQQGGTAKDDWTQTSVYTGVAFAIGRDAANVVGAYDGKFAELIILTAAISTADHNTIGADMATRFGLSWTTVT